MSKRTDGQDGARALRSLLCGTLEIYLDTLSGQNIHTELERHIVLYTVFFDKFRDTPKSKDNKLSSRLSKQKHSKNRASTG